MCNQREPTKIKLSKSSSFCLNFSIPDRAYIQVQGQGSKSGDMSRSNVKTIELKDKYSVKGQMLMS